VHTPFMTVDALPSDAQEIIQRKIFFKGYKLLNTAKKSRIQ